MYMYIFLIHIYINIYLNKYIYVYNTYNIYTYIFKYM